MLHISGYKTFTAADTAQSCKASTWAACRLLPHTKLHKHGGSATWQNSVHGLMFYKCTFELKNTYILNLPKWLLIEHPKQFQFPPQLRQTHLITVITFIYLTMTESWASFLQCAICTLISITAMTTTHHFLLSWYFSYWFEILSAKEIAHLSCNKYFYF